jgi:hypothetical protein
MPNAKNIQWSRLSIEAAAIVASILLAFAIDAWWEDRQDRENEKEYLVSLRQELADSIEFAKENEELRRKVVDAHVSLIAQVQGAKRAPDRDLYEWISLLSYPLRYYPPRAVYNDIMASGGTNLISSAEIRMALAELEQGIRFLAQNDESSWVVWEQRIQPFLEGRIPRIERLRQGYARDRRDIPFGKSPHTADFDAIFADPAFEDMIAERWLRLQNGTLTVGRIISQSRKIVDLISAEHGVGSRD